MVKKKMLESRVGAFNNFNSTAQHLVVALLDRSNDAEGLLDRALQPYAQLKRELHTSSYLPLVAMLLAEYADPGRYDELVARTGRIWERMYHDHPWMSDSDDFSLCAMLAMSKLTDDELFDRIDQCFTTLKNKLAYTNGHIYSMSHMLALTPGDTDAKCQRVLALTDTMKKSISKWSTGHEIPVLAILAGDARPVEELAAAITDNDRWFDTQKGFGFFSMVSRMQRFLYASLLTQDDADHTLAAMLCEQAAIHAAMGAAIEENSRHTRRARHH